MTQKQGLQIIPSLLRNSVLVVFWSVLVLILLLVLGPCLFAIYLVMKFQHGLQIVGKVIPFPWQKKEPPPMPEEKYFFVAPQPSKAFAELKGNTETAPRKSSLFHAPSASTSNPWNGKGLSGINQKTGNTFLKLQNMNARNVIN